MKNLKTKLSNFLKAWGVVILLNLLVIAVFAATIIESFFWKEVPYNMQHFTKDLPTYLIYYRTVMISFGCLFLIGVDTFFYVESRPSKKKEDKDHKKEDESKDA